MNLKDSVDQVADFLWDLVTSDPGDSVQQFTSDPSQFMADHGHDGLTADDLDAAFGRLADRLPAEQFAQVAPVRMATQGFAASGPVGPQAAPLLGSSSGMHASMAAHAAVAPRPQVVRQVEQRVTQVRETPTEVQHVTQQHHNVTNNHYLREGDTVVDNRTVTEINARGDVDFDQRIDTRTVVATKGGVAVDGDVEDSAINTGKNTGVLAGDDVELEDSIVGDGNTQLNDSEVGAFSGRGNATNITGENVNTGSGDLTSVRAGGDAQVAGGNGNRFSGDTDVDFDRVDGPANVIVGDENAQQGQEDNSTRAEDSFNTDASTDGSHNTAVEDSGNRVSTDNDTERTHVEGSANHSVEDNDTNTLLADDQLADGGSPNGQPMDGQLANGQELDGTQIDGHQLDGQELDGNQLDGHQLDGQELGSDGLGGEDLAPSLIHSPLDEFDDPDFDDI